MEQENKNSDLQKEIQAQDQALINSVFGNILEKYCYTSQEHQSNQKNKPFPQQSIKSTEIISVQHKQPTSNKYRQIADYIEQKQKQQKYKPSFYFSNKQRHLSKIQSKNQMNNIKIFEQKTNRSKKQIRYNDAYLLTLIKQRNKKDDDERQQKYEIQYQQQQAERQSSLKSQILSQRNLIIINDSPIRQNFKLQLKKLQQQNKQQYCDQKQYNTLNNQVQIADEQQFLTEGKLKDQYQKYRNMENQFKNQLDIFNKSINKKISMKQPTFQRDNHSFNQHNQQLNVNNQQNNRKSSSQRKKIFSHISPISLQQSSKKPVQMSPTNHHTINQQQKIHLVNHTPKSQSANKQYFSSNIYRSRQINFAKIKRELINSRIKYYRSNEKDIISSIEKRKQQLILKINQQFTPEKRKLSKSSKSHSPNHSKNVSPKNSKRNSPKNIKITPKNVTNKLNHKDNKPNILNMMIVDDTSREDNQNLHYWYEAHKIQIQAQSKRICEFDIINRYLNSSEIETSLQNFIISKIEPKRWILLIVDQVYNHLKDRYKI